MSWSSRCAVCNPSDTELTVDEDPHWRVMRCGDLATTWACEQHLSEVCSSMQRSWERTELVIREVGA